MTDATFPQCRITTERLLNPETTEKLLNQIIRVPGIRRMVLNGPRLPANIPYGPAKGLPNPHPMRKTICIGDHDLDLQVHVGSVLLEIEERDVIPRIKSAIEPIFTTFTFRIQEGKYLKTDPSLVDYCKYGPDADKDLLGLSDPKSRSRPLILQGIK